MAMNRKRRVFGRLNLILSIVIAAAIWIVASVIATRPEYKLLVDMTPQAQFSVGAETKSLIADLQAGEQSVRIDTFFAPLPGRGRTSQERHLLQIQRRIQELTADLLTRYRELGGDRVEVEHYDVLRDVARSRSRIDEIGRLEYQNSIVVSLGERHKELSLELDLAQIDNPALRQTNAPGAQKALPRLEYYKGEEAISSAIRSLMAEGTPKIYFLVGYDQAELTQARADSYSELLLALNGDGFVIDRWNLDDGPIPNDARIVGLMEPNRELPQDACDKLYDFVVRGGRLFVNVSFSSVGRNWNPTLDALGERLGFQIGRELVCHLVQDPSNPNQAMGGPESENLLILNMAPHELTEPLRRTGTYPRLKVAREIRSRELPAGTKINFDPNLLRTGPQAWLTTADGAGQVNFAPPPNAEAYASRSVGAVIDVYEGGETGHVVLLSGAAFLNAGFEINGDLGLNIFNWMASRSELVTVRGQRYQSKRLQFGPQQSERAQSLVRWIVPGLLLAAGVVVVLFRSRR